MTVRSRTTAARKRKSKKDLAAIIQRKQQPLRVVYVSSYIPKRCGIATFTNDLTTAINNINTKSLAEIMVIHNTEDDFHYPWEAKIRIGHDRLQDYINAAKYINESSADVVNLQHEFGLYGGKNGDYILAFVKALQKPLVTTFHSVEQKPSPQRAKIMRSIIRRSDAVIAMTQRSRRLINTLYKCNPHKSIVIYHGVPDFTFNESKKYREKLGITCKNMIMCSGFMGPGKGFEYVFEAMAKIVSEFPRTKLYVVGPTHPDLVKREKEAYRESLEAIMKRLKIKKNVVFVNEFLGLDELINYFKAADFYVTPHLDPQQSTSGTLAKALGAGKVCISTPYYYAKEMLKSGTGILVPFRNADAIAEAVINTLQNPTQMERLERKAYAVGRLMVWPSVAKQYLDVFRVVNGNSHDD